MDTEKAEGMVQEIGGKVQDAAGALVGDSATQLAGKAWQLSGKTQRLCADAASAIRETTAARPFATLAVVAVASFVAGAIWSAGSSRRDTR